MEPISVEQMYGLWLSDEERDTALDRSLGPRSSKSLVDTVEALGFGPSDTILDIGARDGRHSVTLVERLGCNVVAVDPVGGNVDKARELIAASAYPDRIEARQGTIEEIPAEDGSFDLVFSRDMLSHVLDLPAALGECSRVLVGRGRVVVYQTFATDRLEPREAGAIYANLAIVPERMKPEHFETDASQAGFALESRDVIGSEWREAWEEDGSGRTSRQLLHAARLLRAGDELAAELGDVPYRVELASALWGVYQMIGKLEPRIYVLRKG